MTNCYHDKCEGEKCVFNEDSEARSFLANQNSNIDLSLYHVKTLPCISSQNDTVNMHFGAGQSRLDPLVLNQRIFVVYNKTVLLILD